MSCATHDSAVALLVPTRLLSCSCLVYYIKLVTAGEVFTEDRSDFILERAFGSIDTNMNELLEADEIVGALKKLGISAVTRLMR